MRLTLVHAATQCIPLAIASKSMHYHASMIRMHAVAN